jgi:hypothetical protein
MNAYKVSDAAAGVTTRWPGERAVLMGVTPFAVLLALFALSVLRESLSGRPEGVQAGPDVRPSGEGV